MKRDIQIQRDVNDELKWQPFLYSSEIGVALKKQVKNKLAIGTPELVF